MDAKPAFHPRGAYRQVGFSLIEVVLFILIVGVALSAVLNVYNLSAVGSVDPALQRQSLAIAQAMLEEIRGQPFGSADTDDVDQGGFAGDYTPENRRRFDDVDDYAGFSMHGARTLDNVALAGLEDFDVSVAVVSAAFGGVPEADGYRITVTVTDPSGRPLVLQGYRANY